MAMLLGLLVALLGILAPGTGPCVNAMQHGHTIERAAINRKAVEFSPTIALQYVSDVLLEDTPEGPSSRCLSMLKRASAFNAKHVNFIVTYYFVDRNNDSRVEGLCLRSDESHECSRYTVHSLSRYMDGLKVCIDTAMKAGMDVMITPTLEDGEAFSNKWKNAIEVDPVKQYADILINPVASVLGALIQPHRPVWFCMQGGMNLALMRQPERFLHLYTHIRNVILQKRPPSQYLLHVGACLNHEKLNGHKAVSNAIEATVMFDVPRIGKLLNAVDFIGVNLFPLMNGSGDTLNAQFEHPLQQLDKELHGLGLSLAQMTQTKPLVVTEYGFGGGTSSEGDQAARSAAQVRATPYYGIVGDYKRSTDPWQTSEKDDSKVPARVAAREMYATTAAILKAGGGPQYRLDALFLHNWGSWDVLGVHWGSTSKEGTYYEEGVAKIVKEHNAGMAAAGAA